VRSTQTPNHAASDPVKRQRPGLSGGQIATLFGARFVMCIAVRVSYPLLPFFAVHFGIDLKTASILVTAGLVAIVASTFSGVLSDKIGQVQMMRLCLFVFALGTLLSGFSGGFTGYVLGSTLMCLATTGFFVPMQAFVGDCIEFEKLGRSLSLLEIAWGLAGFLGVPLLAFMIITTNDLSKPFLCLTVLTALLFAATWSLPKAIVNSKARSKSTGKLMLTPKICMLLSIWMLFLFANEQVFVCSSAATKQFFGASDMQLSVIFAFLGLAEILGSSLASAFVDRISKRRSLIVGLIALAALEALLPLAAGNFWIFATIFFCFDACIEFTFIPLIVFISDTRPDSRASVMAMAMATMGMARALSSVVSIPLWQSLGFGANAALASGLTILALCIAAKNVREQTASLS
jgi:predicted MFS family arabinose efflux permease